MARNSGNSPYKAGNGSGGFKWLDPGIGGVEMRPDKLARRFYLFVAKVSSKTHDAASDDRNLPWPEDDVNEQTEEMFECLRDSLERRVGYLCE